MYHLIISFAGIVFLGKYSMELNDYDQLLPGEKMEVLSSKGIFIDRYFGHRETTNLYYLYNFFVELVFTNEKGSANAIVSFKKSDRLEKYLKKINLKGLI